MKLNFYKAHTNEFFRGKKAILRHPLRNGWAVLAAGTQVTIERKHSGFSIVSDKCNCCNVSVLMTKVMPHNLDLIEDGDEE